MKSHLKRLVAPKTWPIMKKDNTFITRPAGTGTAMALSIPIVIACKDMLGLAATTKEVKHILHDHEVFVNGVRVYDHDKGVGFLSTFSIPAQKINYRLTINTKNTLTFIPVTSEEANMLPARIEGKTVLKKGVQLNCSGGMNIVVAKDEYATGGTVLIDLKKKTVAQYFAFDKGVKTFLYKGTHIGHTAIIEEVTDKEVLLKTDDGQVFETRKDYCFVLGKDKPAFKL